MNRLAAFVITLVFAYPISTFAQIEYNKVLDIELPSTANAREANFYLLSSIIANNKKLKARPDCQLITWLEPSLMACCSEYPSVSLCPYKDQTLLREVQYSIDTIDFFELLNEHDVPYRISPVLTNTFEEVSKKISKTNSPVLFISFDDNFKLSTVELIIGYDSPDTLIVNNPVDGIRYMKSTQLIKSQRLFTALVFFEEKNLVLTSSYSWQPDRYTDKFGICRKKTKFYAFEYGFYIPIFPNSTLKQCFFTSSRIGDIEVLLTNSRVKKLWDEADFYPNEKPSYDKAGVVKTGEDDTKTLCKVTRDKEYFGEYKGDGYCYFSENGSSSIRISKEFKLLYLIPESANESRQELTIRTKVQITEQLFLAQIKALKPIEVKNSQGQIINGYSINNLDTIVAETKRRLLLIFNEEKYSGIRRYINEDFPSPKDFSQYIVKPQMENQSLLFQKDVIDFTKISFIASPNIRQLSIITGEGYSEFTKRVLEFFKPTKDKTLIHIQVIGNPEGSKVTINNYFGDGANGFINMNEPIFRGKYKIIVSKPGFKTYSSKSLNLMQKITPVIQCNLVRNDSENESSCQ